MALISNDNLGPNNAKKGEMNMKEKWVCIFAILLLAGWVLAPAAYGQEKAKPDGVMKAAGPFEIARLVVGTGVENREPAGVAEKFPASTEKLYCFLEAVNIPKDTEITLVWFNGEKEAGKFKLNLKQGPKWRTWAFKNLRGVKGEWKAEVKDADGRLMKDVKFKVE
jgi:hypothetical protein